MRTGPSDDAGVHGVAGGLDPALDVGDVVVADRIIQHDAGVLGDEGIEAYQAGHIPFFNPTDILGFMPSERLRLAVRNVLGEPPSRLADGARISYGTVLTGDQFVASDRERARLHERFAAQAVEMEGGAVAQVADRYGCDHLAVRTISDRAGVSSPADFSAVLDSVAQHTIEVVRLLLPALAAARDS